MWLKELSHGTRLWNIRLRSRGMSAQRIQMLALDVELQYKFANSYVMGSRMVSV